MTTEHPILFNGEMVRAILGGRKTQTRRPIPWKWAPTQSSNGHWSIYTGDGTRVMLVGATPEQQLTMCRGMIAYGRVEVGDTLWVRETWGAIQIAHSGLLLQWRDVDAEHRTERASANLFYRADGDDIDYTGCWIPSIHMPRWASRITLEVTGVRAERVQNISDDDQLAEGVPPYELSRPDYLRRAWFSGTWDSIYARRELGWDTNPWVWAITFKRITDD